MATIQKIEARPVLDSRGTWTIEVLLALEDGTLATASVPQGKSTGSREAVSLPALQALENIEDRIAPALEKTDPGEQTDLDVKLYELDGSATYENLGANAVLGVSVAYGRAVALSRGIQYWEYIASVAGTTPSLPRLYANLINGGAHAGNGLAFQEYLVIPKATDAFAAVVLIQSLYQAVGDILRSELGPQATLIGDEGGYAPLLENDLAPFEIIMRAAEEVGIENEIELGLDAAATGIEKSQEELFELYTKMASEFPFIYLEDPFDEESFADCARLQTDLGSTVAVTGDDMTVTQALRIEEAVTQNALRGVIIKPNQNGTITGTIEAAAKAREAGYRTVVSHRSGETNDTWIADIAVSLGADGFKLGAPARGERVAKYNALVEIAQTDFAETS